MNNDDSFRILVIGDFSGRVSRAECAPLEGRRPVLVDRDNIDEVMASMRPVVRLPQGEFRVASLDDFHPDKIYARTGAFAAAHTEPSPRTEARRAAAPSGGGLLDELLDEGDEADAADNAGDLSAFLRKVTAGHLETRPDPGATEAALREHAAASEGLRAILHHRQFQALEAAWRGVDFLVRRLETGEDLKVYVLDATIEELLTDLPRFGKILQPNGSSWALIVANYAFGQSAAEAGALRILGALARTAGAPIVAEALPPSGDAAPEWAQLRASGEAEWIGLALPRFLLRLPYGPKTSAVESFPFEEMPIGSQHDTYLWGSPAFACAYLLGLSFLADGWKMQPGTHREVTGLPLHVYTEHGQTELKPCAEALMTEKDAGFLLQQGIMPLATLKEQDAALLVRFQSIAQPPAALRGRWTN